jgi:hypothetical protein
MYYHIIISRSVVVVAAAVAAIAVWEEENLYNTTTLSLQHFSGTRVQHKSHLIIHTIAIITKKTYWFCYYTKFDSHNWD